MGEKMTLIQQLRGRAAFLRDRGRIKSPRLMEQAADALAHLTQPAQAVDVTFDMVREAEHFCPTDLPHSDKLRWKARKLTELLTAAIPNANGKEG